MPKQKPVLISRRQFLTRCLQIITGFLFSSAVPALTLQRSILDLKERDLSFYNLHTGEKLSIVYWAEGRYLDNSLTKINHFLRDFRNNEIKAIDPALLDQLYAIQSMVKSKSTIQVISGYRSPKSNDMLVQQKRGAVKNSYHTLGKAIDFKMADVPLSHLKDAARSLKAGGVGYYPRSGFIHIDTGPVRQW